MTFVKEIIGFDIISGRISVDEYCDVELLSDILDPKKREFQCIMSAIICVECPRRWNLHGRYGTQLFI